MLKIPFYRQQTAYTCGPAVLRMALGFVGRRRSEGYLARLCETNAKTGTSNFGLMRCLRKFDIEYMTWYRARYEELQRYARRGCVIVDWAPQFVFPDHPEFRHSREFNPEEDSHYAIVVSAGGKFVTLQDPVLGRRLRVLRSDFVRAWRDPCSKSYHWMLVIFPPENQ